MSLPGPRLEILKKVWEEVEILACSLAGKQCPMCSWWSCWIFETCKDMECIDTRWGWELSKLVERCGSELVWLVMFLVKVLWGWFWTYSLLKGLIDVSRKSLKVKPREDLSRPYSWSCFCNEHCLTICFCLEFEIQIYTVKVYDLDRNMSYTTKTFPIICETVEGPGDVWDCSILSTNA